MATEWMRFTRRSRARARVFCFHHAGGGAALFRPWALAAPEDWDLVAAQLPGRAHRLRDPLITSMTGLVDALLPTLRRQLDLPFVFFGHSMGAVLAAELADALRRDGGPTPEHLAVSGRRPPHLPGPDAPMHGLPDDEFVAEVNRRYGGIPAELLRDREVLDLLLPGLRADITVLETHQPPSRPPFTCPITAYGGADDPVTPLADLEAWRTMTTGPVRVRQFPGGHFYLTARMPEVLSDLLAASATFTCHAHAEDVRA